MSESRNFYAAYRRAFASLEEKEAHVTFALAKLDVAKRTLQNSQIDVEALRFFSIPGTLQEINEYTNKLYEKQRESLQKVKEYNTVVTRLLREPRYIELKHTVETYQVQLKYYQSHGLFR